MTISQSDCLNSGGLALRYL